MAKEKKNRRKGIVDPRKAERAQRRAAASQGKAESDAELATKAYRANKIAKAIASDKPETETTAEVTPPASVPQLDEDVKLGYAGRPIPRGERPVAKLDAADVADDAAQAAIIREDDARQAKIESGEAVQPRTPLDVVRGIQERRAAAEQERVAGKARVDLPSAVDGFDEVSEGEVVRRSAGRTARRGTGLVDFGSMAGGGRGRAGLTAEQSERAARRLSEREQRTERRSAAEEAFGGVVEGQSGLRPYTDTPEVMDLARRLKTSDLMDQGKDITPEAVEEGLQGSHHQRLARIIHHTGLSAEEVQGYAGGRQSMAVDKINELHETVMRNVRSRRKNDVLSRMGLARGEDGSITATEGAQNETWQHPTEKDANGLPKTYKVSDMHPDMLKELQHPWGGVQSENEFEGTAVLRETPALPSGKSPALRYATSTMKSAGDYLPVSIRFGHNKNAAGSWSFTPPPAGFETGNPEGLTSNVTHIVDAIREGRTRGRGTRKSHAEVANNLIAELDPAKQRVIGKRQVAVPMPGFTQDGGKPATTAYEPMVTDVPHAGNDSMVTYDDLPHVKDQHGNLVPLAPRAGRAGTGRSVHVVQGTMGLGQQFTSPAEESAKTLMGFEVTPATEKTRTRKLKDGTEKVTTRQVPGVVSNVAEGAMAGGERSSQSRRLIRGNRAVGKQFMGADALAPEYRVRNQTQIIPGFEKYGNVERQRGIPAVVDTKFAEGPLPESVGTRSDAGLVERTTRLNAQPAETISTGIPDQRSLRLRAEAESGRGVIGAVEQPAPAKAAEYTQPELDFNPTSPGVVRTRQFMLGTVRPLTDAEKSVENVGANTIRGMNPPARNFDVGAPTATAAPSTVQTPVSSGEVQLSKRGGGRRKLAKGEKVQGTDVVVNSTKGPKKRALKRPSNSAALAE